MTTPAGRTDVQAWTDTVDPQTIEAVPGLLSLMTSAWAEPDQQTRVQILDRCLAPAVTFTNPLASVEGTEAVATLIGQVRAQYPGYLPARTSGIDLHHRHARYEFAMQDRAGRNALVGINIITLDEVPLIRSVLGFFGPAPRITYTYGRSR
jgi:hypothetical protein